MRPGAAFGVKSARDMAIKGIEWEVWLKCKKWAGLLL